MSIAPMFNERYLLSPYALSVLKQNALEFGNLISHSQVVKRRDLANWFEKIGEKYLRPNDDFERRTIEKFITTLRSSLAKTTRLYRVQSALNIKEGIDGNLTISNKYADALRKCDQHWLNFEVELRNIFLAFRYNNWTELTTSAYHNPTEHEKLCFRIFYNENPLLDEVIMNIEQQTYIMENRIRIEEIRTNKLKVS